MLQYTARIAEYCPDVCFASALCHIISFQRAHNAHQKTAPQQTAVSQK